VGKLVKQIHRTIAQVIALNKKVNSTSYNIIEATNNPLCISTLKVAIIAIVTIA
jgi:hypothetical protein